jgi:hypothetical protein
MSKFTRFTVPFVGIAILIQSIIIISKGDFTHGLMLIALNYILIHVYNQN